MIFINLDILDETTQMFQTYEFNILRIIKITPIVKNDIDKGSYIWTDDDVCYMSNEPIDVIMIKINNRKDEVVNTLIASLMIKVTEKPKRRYGKK